MDLAKEKFYKAYVSSVICLFVLSGFNIVLDGAQGKIMACYFTVRKAQNFSGSSVDPHLCSHMILAGGNVTPNGIVALTPVDMEQYKAVASLKDVNPNLKVMVSLSKGFSSVVDQPSTTVMERFAVRAVTFLEKMNMDGLDLDWEFPKVYEKQMYITFIKILSTYLHGSNMLLSMALPAEPFYIDNGFDLSVINKNVDFVTVMNYDYHYFREGYDNITGYNSALYTPKGDSMYSSTADSLTFFLAKGLSREKMLMGIPTYGHSWNLSDPNVHGLHSPANNKGDPGPYGASEGVYLFSDVGMAQAQGAITVKDEVNVGEYLYNGSTWVAFEGFYSLTKKMQWLKERDLAGVGIWAYQLDDLYGVGGYGKLPLLNFIKKNLNSGALYFGPENRKKKRL